VGNGIKTGTTLVGAFLLGSLCSFLPAGLQGYKLGMLGDDPDWNSLDIYQETMSRADFVSVLDTIYLPYGYDRRFVSVDANEARIKMNEDEGDQYYTFRFAPSVELEEPEAISTSFIKNKTINLSKDWLSQLIHDTLGETFPNWSGDIFKSMTTHPSKKGTSL
jgi:hypothetical protein